MAEICVAYVTKTGTSKEMAETIASELIMQGIQTDVRELKSLENPDEFKTLIVGGPINGMRMSEEFTSQISRIKAPGNKILGVFAASMLYFHGRRIWVNAIEKSLRNVSAQLGAGTWGVFGGRANEPMPGFVRWIFGTPAAMPLDTVDWDRLKVWSQRIADDWKNSK